MKRRPQRLRSGWDILESRVCPSQSATPPVVPVERTDAYAVARYKQDLQQVATGQDSVVFFGDSITDWWANGAGAQVWGQQIAPLGAADFGIANDTAEDLLWRVDSGELAGHPKVAVVEVGTNDLGEGESVDTTVRAIEAVVDAIEELSPSTRIVLMGLFPRGSADDPIRTEIAQVNTALAAWAPGAGATFLDIDAALTDPDGSLTTDFLDEIHPNAFGYEVWADAVVRSVLDQTDPGRTAVVEELYETILGRPADPLGLEHDVTAMESGTTASQLAAAMDTSAEYDTRVVDADYQTYLGRAADDFSLGAYVSAMQGGWTEAQVAEALIDTPEFSVVKASAPAFVEALYQDVLGRTGSASEVAAWVNALGSGLSRSSAATAFVTSAEAGRRAVADDYVTLLGRSGSTAEVAAWSSLLADNLLTPDGVAEAFIGSPEFAARAAKSEQIATEVAALAPTTVDGAD